MIIYLPTVQSANEMNNLWRIGFRIGSPALKRFLCPVSEGQRFLHKPYQIASYCTKALPEPTPSLSSSEPSEPQTQGAVLGKAPFDKTRAVLGLFIHCIWNELQVHPP